jgi:hypothetical protein
MTDQLKLFNEEKKETPAHQFEWRRFCALGEMIGDGLHNEPDGKWISKEYKALSKILIPNIGRKKSKYRQQMNLQIDESMKKLLEHKKCECGGLLVQSRSGSFVCYCEKCNQRYKAKTK